MSKRSDTKWQAKKRDETPMVSPVQMMRVVKDHGQSAKPVESYDVDAAILSAIRDAFSPRVATMALIVLNYADVLDKCYTGNLTLHFGREDEIIVPQMAGYLGVRTT